jgi:hypothetical protein
LGRQALVLPAKEITAAQGLQADQAKAAVVVAQVAWAETEPRDCRVMAEPEFAHQSRAQDFSMRVAALAELAPLRAPEV